MIKTDDIAKALLDLRPSSKPDQNVAPGPMDMGELSEFKDSKVRGMMDRILELKAASDAGDLVFMDYDSWFRSGNLFQVTLRATVNPLFWGACFFEKSKFFDNFDELGPTITPDTQGTILETDGRFQMVLANHRIDAQSHRRYRRQFSGKGTIVSRFSRNGVEK